MYAGLHLLSPKESSQALQEVALAFTPLWEQAEPDTVVFPVLPLQKLYPTLKALSTALAQRSEAQQLCVNVAVAPTPDTVLLLCRSYQGITICAVGQEPALLSPLPLAVLEPYAALDSLCFSSWERWGLKTCADLVALPETGVAERWGHTGVFFRNLALGRVSRPLRLRQNARPYRVSLELEYPVETMDSLLFLVSRELQEFCRRLRRESQAARRVSLQLQLCSEFCGTDKEAAAPDLSFRCDIEFPIPLQESRSILKLLQLQLERQSLAAPIRGWALELEPMHPKRVQRGLFVPPTPAPDQLAVTLARIAGLVGSENVGSPELLNTHRPDAFRLRVVLPATLAGSPTPGRALRLARRLYRPPLPAQVQVVRGRPTALRAAGLQGAVVKASGPWRGTGDWWAAWTWGREEWDVQLTDGALYGIYCDTNSQTWYVQAVYD